MLLLLRAGARPVHRCILDKRKCNYHHELPSWFDRTDTWASVLTNAHLHARTAEYQKCGRFNFADMLSPPQPARTGERAPL